MFQVSIIKKKRFLFPLLLIFAVLGFRQIFMTYLASPRVRFVVYLNRTEIPIDSKTIKLEDERNLKKSNGFPVFRSQKKFNFDKGNNSQGNEINEILDKSNLDEIIDKEILEVQIWQKDPECADFSIRFAKKNAIRARALVSFPGSGNHWVRYLIESSTGIFTGDQEPAGYRREFPGESHKANDGTTIVQKTHHNVYAQVGTSDYVEVMAKESEAIFGYRGILIIRNPFDAILSQWSLKLTRSHMGHASEDSFSKKQLINANGTFWPAEWKLFVEVAGKQWAELIEVWITKSHDLHVVVYEESKRNLEGELLGILQYLKHPIDSKRIKCTLRHNEGSFHRKHVRINKIKIYRDTVNTPGNSTLEKIFLSNIKKVNLFLLERRYPLQLDYDLQQ